MYIGPDSLALVHHFHAIFWQFWKSRQLSSKSNADGSSGKTRSISSSSDAETTSYSFATIAPFKVLDLCAGSGIQALAVLSMLQMLPSSECNVDGAGENALAVAVDINKRALRFTEFNSILNGFGVVDFETGKDTFNGNQSRIKICTVNADLVSDKVLNRDSVAKDKTGIELTDETLVDQLLFIFRRNRSNNETALNDSRFDVLLANPPFIPVPPKVSDNRVLSVFGNQDARGNTPHYGLFSSGGEDGEECLRAIIQMAPLLLSPGAMAGIVSEFMNPPLTQSTELDPALCSKIEKWWDCAFDLHSVSPLVAKGILFTNEYALSSATYAQRRALRNDQDGVLLWKDHLDQKGIDSVSPGLLFVRVLPNEMVFQTRSRSKLECHSNPSQRETILMHRFVPKTTNGSIWTPHNFNAVEFTRIDLVDLFLSYEI
jgi:methylase of polypeptide subunit release factors